MAPTESPPQSGVTCPAKMVRATIPKSTAAARPATIASVSTRRP